MSVAVSRAERRRSDLDPLRERASSMSVKALPAGLWEFISTSYTENAVALRLGNGFGGREQHIASGQNLKNFVVHGQWVTGAAERHAAQAGVEGWR